MKKNESDYSTSEMRLLSYNGLRLSGREEAKLFHNFMKILLPSVSHVAGRNINLVRKEVRGPVVFKTGRIQSECIFNQEGDFNCEIRLYEGFFLALRCFSEIISSLMYKPRKINSLIGVS